jgi:hypothetical protein
VPQLRFLLFELLELLLLCLAMLFHLGDVALHLVDFELGLALEVCSTFGLLSLPRFLFPV